MPYTTLSYLCEETKKSDARAYKELMKHIKDFDGEEKYCDYGASGERAGDCKGAARENSDHADEIFKSEVPQEFVAFHEVQFRFHG